MSFRGDVVGCRYIIVFRGAAAFLALLSNWFCYDDDHCMNILSKYNIKNCKFGAQFLFRILPSVVSVCHWKCGATRGM